MFSFASLAPSRPCATAAELRLYVLLAGVLIATFANTASETLAQESVADIPATTQPETSDDASGSSDATTSATSPGQTDLDEAIVKRIDADSPQSLDSVAALLESAIGKGLDDENESFAKKMLGSVLMQRAQALAATLPTVRGRRQIAVRDEVLRNLEDAVENDPSLVEALMMIARINLLPGGDRESIKEATSKAIDLLKRDPEQLSAAYALRALINEDTEEKFADLDAALKADSKNKEALTLRANLRLQNDNIEGAIEDLEQLLIQDPTNEIVAGTAIESLLKLERVEQAIELITKTLAAQPSEGMYRMRAILYQADERYEEAMADLDKAIAMAPKDPRTLMQRAMIALDRDDVKSAKADFNAATAIAPQILAADQGVELKLQIALKENRIVDAINDAQLLVDRQPENPFRRLRLATLYTIDKRPRKAIEIMSTILDGDPENVAVLRSRGDAWLSVGDHSKAIEDYEAAITAIGDVTREDSSPRTIEEASGLYNNLSWVLATSPEDEVRDGKRSLELAEKSSELTEYLVPHILSTLAAAHAEVGDFEAARKWSTKAVELAKEEDHDQLKQLEEEFEAYQEDKPWREAQETKENDIPILDPKDLIDT